MAQGFGRCAPHDRLNRSRSPEVGERAPLAISELGGPYVAEVVPQGVLGVGDARAVAEDESLAVKLDGEVLEISAHCRHAAGAQDAADWLSGLSPFRKECLPTTVSGELGGP